MSPICLIITIFIYSVSSKDIKDMNLEELVNLAEDISQIRPNDVQISDLSFFLYTQNVHGLELNRFGDDGGSNNTNLDPLKTTKMLIHGWLENHQTNWYQQLTHEYLQKDDYNIIQIDWERVARSSYISSAKNTKLVGGIIARFILNHNISLEHLHLIGHSLGAHVAGFTAKTIEQQHNNQQRIARITGLDPAGPYFREFFITPSDRLDPNDAKIVDIYHTDDGFYGYEQPLGTLDIYINGGKRIQPGCVENFKISPSVGELIEDSFCSHSRSCQYFIDIVNRDQFTCIKCDSWENFQRATCNNNEKYVIGAEDIDEKMIGKCYVSTKQHIKTPIYLGNLIDLITKIH